MAEEETVGIVTLSFGRFEPALGRLQQAGKTVLVQVQDMNGLASAVRLGAAAVIVQGNEAGGHTGQRGTLGFAAQALAEAGPTPVVVAGGIGDGRRRAAALAMGAAGIAIGTRFKAFLEFDGGPEHKQAIAASDGSNITVDPATDAAYPTHLKESSAAEAEMLLRRAVGLVV